MPPPSPDAAVEGYTSCPDRLGVRLIYVSAARLHRRRLDNGLREVAPLEQQRTFMVLASA